MEIENDFSERQLNAMLMEEEIFFHKTRLFTNL